MPDNQRLKAAEQEAGHTERIRGLFASIAGGYDFLNRFNSLRRDVAWRRAAVKRMRFAKTMRYLDVATGTADLALEAVRSNPGVSAVGVDLVEELMAIGRAKAERMGLSERIELKQGNALELDFADGSFDVAGIAFGIRNIQQREHALREMTRVVVPGGQVVVLELTFACGSLLRGLYRFYLTKVMPAAARLLSKNPDAYVYLAKSILDFPAPHEFMDVMRRAGLEEVEHRPLTFGVAGLFVGRKPRQPA